MKLEQLILKEFMGWAYIDVDLSKYSGIVAILGAIESDMAHSNGTGKSSLINAINYSLFGTAPCKGLDGMIRQGAEEEGYIVTLRFSQLGTQYEVVRKKKLGSPQKTTFKNLTDKKPMSITVEEFLRMPEVVWQNTVYSAQRNLSAFVDKTPSVRKDILTEVFGMNSYLELETKARQLSTKSETDLVGAQWAADAAKTRIGDIKVTREEVDNYAASLFTAEAGETMLASAVTEVAVKLENVEQRYSSYAAQEADVIQAERVHKQMLERRSGTQTKWEMIKANYEERITQLELAAEDDVDPHAEEILKIQIQTAEQSRASLQEQTQACADLVQRVATAAAEKNQSVLEAVKLRARIDNLPKDKCPLCGTGMTEDHLNAHKADMEAEIQAAELTASTCQESINNLNINLYSIRGEMARLSAVVNSIPDLSRKLFAEQQKVIGRNAAIDGLNKMRESLAAESASYDTELATMLAEIQEQETIASSKRASLPAVGDLVDEKAVLTQERENLATQLSATKSTLATMRQAFNRACDQLEAKHKLIKELEALEIAVKAAELQRNTHLELVKAFGPAGIPTLILENCLSELQQYLDHYMAILSDGKIHVTFQTTKTSASTSKTSETLSIMVSDINGERDIALYSGGETVRIYLAIRLALAKLLYLKSGQKLGLMIIDEIADLDDAGLLAFTDLLKRIEPEFEQILLVSHLPELKSSFNNALVLTRDLEGNYIPA